MLDTTVLQLRDPEKFREAIAASPLTQTEVAVAGGISRARLHQLLKGGGSIGTPVPNALGMCAAIDVDASDHWHFPDGEALQRLGFIQ